MNKERQQDQVREGTNVENMDKIKTAGSIALKTAGGTAFLVKHTLNIIEKSGPAAKIGSNVMIAAIVAKIFGIGYEFTVPEGAVTPDAIEFSKEYIKHLLEILEPHVNLIIDYIITATELFFSTLGGLAGISDENALKGFFETLEKTSVNGVNVGKHITEFGILGAGVITLSVSSLVLKTIALPIKMAKGAIGVGQKGGEIVRKGVGMVMGKGTA